MKITLKKFDSLRLLKRNEKLHAECCYILNSESVSKNTYFESKRDVVRAHEMFTKHLCPIMNILDYLITPSGWLLVVTIKSKSDVIASANAASKMSAKMRHAIENKDISTIVSERIRYAISGTVTRYNKRIERCGTVVSRNFSRFIFTDINGALNVMKKMKQEQINLCWQKKRYSPCLKSYDIDGEFEPNGDVFLCTKNYGSLLEVGGSANMVVKIFVHKLCVLRKVIKKTINAHLFKNSPFPNPLKL